MSAKMETLCLVCCQISTDMYLIESEAGRRRNLDKLLHRFGGILVDSGRICRTDFNALITLERRADGFYNQCQKALAKRQSGALLEHSVQLQTLNENKAILKECPAESKASSIISDSAEIKTEFCSVHDQDFRPAQPDVSDPVLSNNCLQDITSPVPSPVKLCRNNRQRAVVKTKTSKEKRQGRKTKKSLHQFGESDSDNTIMSDSVFEISAIKIEEQEDGMLNECIVQVDRLSKGSEDIHGLCNNTNNFTNVNGMRHIAESGGMLGSVVKCSSKRRDKQLIEDTSTVIMKERKKRIRNRRRFEPSICPICGSFFTSRSGFDSHVKTHRKDAGKTHKCIVCGKCFSRPAYLRMHIRTFHITDDDAATNRINLGRRGKVMDPELQNSLKELVANTVPPSFICHECGKKLTSQHKLKYHMEGHESNVKSHKCMSCDKSFRQAYLLKLHMRLHTGDRPFKCSQCPCQFVSAYILRRHCTYNHTIAPIACTECNRHFASQADLAAHMPIHNRLKKYSCPVCARPFRSRSNLSKHKKIHAGSREHHCLICESKSFRSTTHLKRHMNMVHCEVKPYSCTKCKSTFTAKHSLKRHMLLHSEEWCNAHDMTVIALEKNEFAQRQLEHAQMNELVAQ